MSREIKDQHDQLVKPLVRSFVQKITHVVTWLWYGLKTGGLYLLPNGELYKLGD